MGLLNKTFRTLLATQRASQLSMVRHASSKIEPNARWFLYAIPPCAFIIVFVLPTYTPSQIKPIKTPNDTIPWKEPYKPGDEGHLRVLNQFGTKP